MTTITADHFERQYQTHLKHLKLKGLQPKTIEAYSRAIRRVSGAQFLWLVLQHVLPKGFRRARNFGFLHPNCKPPDRLAALAAEVRSGSGAGLGQGAGADPVQLLRGGDGDREDANSIRVVRGHPGAHCRRGGPLTM